MKDVIRREKDVAGEITTNEWDNRMDVNGEVIFLPPCPVGPITISLVIRHVNGPLIGAQ